MSDYIVLFLHAWGLFFGLCFSGEGGKGRKRVESNDVIVKGPGSCSLCQCDLVSLISLLVLMCS